MPHLFPGNVDWGEKLTGLRALGEQEVAGRGRGSPEKCGQREKGKAMWLSEKVVVS